MSVSPRVSVSRSDLPCPRCEQPLFMGDANGIVMHGCGLCGGIWLDNAAAQRVSQRFDERVVDMAGAFELLISALLD